MTVVKVKKAGRKRIVTEDNILELATQLYVKDRSYKAVATELGCDQRTLMKYKQAMLQALEAAQSPSLLNRISTKLINKKVSK